MNMMSKHSYNERIKGMTFFMDDLDVVFKEVERKPTQDINHRLELLAEANITRSGVILYDGEAGFRDHSSISSKEFLKDVEGLPIVKEHVDISVSNRKLYEIGFVLNPYSSGIYIKGNVIIYDEEYIEKIQKGYINQLSIGLYANKINKKGFHEGKPYDFIQENIIFNHVALVERGRAGSQVRILEEDSNKKNNKKGVSNKKMSTESPAVTVELQKKIDNLIKKDEERDSQIKEYQEFITNQMKEKEDLNKKLEEERKNHDKEKEEITRVANSHKEDSMIKDEKEFFEMMNVFSEYSKYDEMRVKVISHFRDALGLVPMSEEVMKNFFVGNNTVANIFYETIKKSILKRKTERELEQKVNLEKAILETVPHSQSDVYKEAFEKMQT